jgi:hypothetical protein
LKEGGEFELRRKSRSLFHSLGAEAWNAFQPITALHRAQLKDPYLMIVGNMEECKELVVTEGREVYWC